LSDAAQANGSGTSPWDPSFHLDTKTWNVVDGDPNKPNDGYFLGGVGQQGAKWSTAGGGFTGNIDQKGIDSTALLGGDKLHLGSDFSKSTGDLTLSGPGGNQLFDVFGGQTGGTTDVGIKNTYGLGGGTSLTPSFEHDITKGAGSEVGKLNLAGDGFSANASATAFDAGGFAAALGGNLTLDPTHSISGNAGLTSQGGKDNLTLGFNDKQGDTTTAYGYNLGLTDKTAGTTVSVSDANDTTKFSQTSGANGSSVGLDLTHKDGSTSYGGGFTMGTDAKGAVADSAHIQGSTAAGGGTLSGNLAVNDKAGALSADAGVSWQGANDKLTLSGHEGGTNDQSITAGYTHTGDGTSFTTTMGAAQTKDGTQVNASETYSSKPFTETGKVTGTMGANGSEAVTGSLSALGQVSPNLYVGGFGGVGTGTNGSTNWNAGVDATYMVSPTVGITGAAGVGSNGAEGRLEADFYSKSVHGADDLAGQQKNPAVSVFLDAASGAGAGLSGGQFGAGNYSTNLGGGGPQVTAGIGFNF
jgi:hypothetical protein